MLGERKNAAGLRVKPHIAISVDGRVKTEYDRNITTAFSRADSRTALLFIRSFPGAPALLCAAATAIISVRLWAA